MQLLYPLYYKQFGVRRVQSLLAPRLFTITSLPRSAMLHYHSEEKDHPDIDVSKLYLGLSTPKILVDYPTTLSCTKLNPKKRATVINSLFRPFHNKNRKFRFLHNHYQRIDDPMTLLIENYSYIDHVYNYVDLPLAPYYRWWNLQKTIWDNVVEVAKVADRNHFVFIDVPETLPGLMILNLASTKMTLSLTKVFDTSEELMICELWKWLSVEKRPESVFADVPKELYAKINFVFTAKDGRSSVINMGYLDSWIQEQANTTEFSNITQYAPIQLQKLFLKYLMNLQSSIPDEVDVIAANNVPGQGDVEKEVIRDPEDVSEDKDLIEAQGEYDEYHGGVGNEPADEHEYEDALSSVTKNKSTSEFIFASDDDKVLDAAMQGADDLMKHFEDLDKDLEVLDTIAMNRLKDRGIHLDGRDDTPVLAKKEKPIAEIHAKIFQFEDHETALKRQVSEYADYGLLSASDYKKLHQDIESFKTIPDPYGSRLPLAKAMIIEPHQLVMSKERTEVQTSHLVQDKSMLHSSLMAMDHEYVSHVLHKDNMSMVASLQKAGVIIRNHTVEVEHSALGSYENHTIEWKPVDGMPSTVRVRIPKIDPDGTFMSGGSKYVMRKQRVDIPIRKINPHSVALTSYYGKTFVSINEKKANNSTEYLIKLLNEASMTDHEYIQRVNPAKVFDNNFTAPYIYNAMADNFKSIITNDFTLVFDHSEREKIVSDPLKLAELEKNGSRVVGFWGKTPMIVDKDNLFHVVGAKMLGRDIFSMLGFDISKAPVDFTEVRIYSKAVPVALVLGYTIGFTDLVRLLGAQVRYVEGRRVKDLQPHEYAIVFHDQTVVLSRKQRAISLILAGFNEYAKQLKTFDLEDFNNKDVYLNLLESKGLGSVYIREMDTTQQLFVDSITKGLLEDMHEPTTFNGLLIRATEMLEHYHHPDSQDMSKMRIRGYERLSGAIYKELAGAIRQYRNKNLSGRSKIDISPYQVWSSIMKDPAIKLVEDINPIQNLKESEIVTYVGEGGRGKDSMNKASRAYHQLDMGIVSEATVDSSDVGVNAYLSANPKFLNLRGIPITNGAITPTSMLSTSALLSPGAEHDDPKRVNFISIQSSHKIPLEAYHQPQLRTGYDYVMANRTTDMFAYTAKQDGKVISLDARGIIVEYVDGTQKGVTLGRVYGKAEGSMYPHDIVCDLKLGQKFKKGAAIAWNKNFFERDILDPTHIVMKTSMLVKTVIYESAQTHEDSSSISKALSARMAAKTTKVRSFVINFNQNLSSIVKPGTRLSPKDLLMLIEDEITSTNNVFDEEALNTLKRLSNQAPKANYLGDLDKIEVFYHGDKSDMSSSLRLLADRSDKAMADTCKSSGKVVINGQVDDDYRVSGTPLTLDKAEVRFYITVSTITGVGDKIIAGNQGKSVVGEVLEHQMVSESGVVIDLAFGARALAARVIGSPYIIGTTNTLLKVFAQRAVEIYRK